MLETKTSLSRKFNNEMILSFILPIIVTCAHVSQASEAKVTVELLNSGFHRDLKYVAVFPDYHGKSHTFLVKQSLPASVYVSTDQLDDLMRFDKINYYVEKDRIDIEKATEQSKPFNIYLFGDTGLIESILLPIHFRYHAPGNKSFVTVGIDFPQVFVEWHETEELTNGTKPVLYTCKDLRHRCWWIEVEYDNYSRKPINANIPIGNAGLSGAITFCTIALSWIAAIFIIIVIHNKSKSLKNKLK